VIDYISPPEADGCAPAESEGRVRRGRGLSWTPAENLALAKAVHAVSNDAVHGANQSAAVFGRCVKAEFSRNRHDEAIGIDADRRRWKGREDRACLSQWTKMKAALVGAQGVLAAVGAMQLTASPTEDDLRRVSISLWNEAHKKESHLGHESGSIGK
jgi:hypothetical protein